MTAGSQVASRADDRRLRHAVDLMRELIARDLRLRYRRSVLGIAWSQLAPLATLAVLVFVFTVVVPLRVPHYAVFVLSGLLAWGWFSGGLVAATDSIVAGRDLVRRPGFRPALLPVVSIGAHLVHYVLALPILLIATLVDVGALTVTLLALPAIMAVQLLITLGPAYLLAAANVRFRDVSHVLSVSLLPLFWATPVFYEPTRVPDAYRGLYRLNPLVWLVEAYRDVLLRGRWPDWSALLVLGIVGGVVAAFGVRRFAASAHRFAEEL